MDKGFVIPEFAHTVITEPDKLSGFYDNIGNNWPMLSFDFETTGLNYMEDAPIGVAIANGRHSWYIHGAAFMELTPWMKGNMADPDIEWAGHNIKFDLHYLVNTVTDKLPPTIFDTQVAQWLLDENDALGLKSLGKRKLGAIDDIPSFNDLIMYTKKLKGFKKKADVTIWDIPMEYLGPYAAYDARLTYDLVDILKKELDQENLKEQFFQEQMPFTKTLLRMERAGVLINQQGAEDLKKEYQAICDDILLKWKKKVGDVNPNSSAQLRTLLFKDMKLKSQKKTKTKLLSTDALVLQRLKRQDKSGVVDLLLEYKKYSKIISTYLNAMINKVGSDGRMRTKFNQTGTVSGRLSSSGDINLQNIPARGDIGTAVRSLFIASPGMKLVGIDYSQIELRILAHYSRDAALVRAFFWGSDPHQLTADRMGVPRYVAKTLNFGIIYGAGAPTVADQIEKLGKPRPNTRVAEGWLREYATIYPSIDRLKKIVILEGIKRGYIETIGGRHRHAENLNHFDNYTRSRAERQIFNSKIQGSAGDVINYAMNKVDAEQAQFGATMMLQVHDELTLEAPEDYVIPTSEFVQSRMEDVQEVFNLSVPIIAEPSIGNTWAEVKG